MTSAPATALPSPRSALISAFIEQTDGAYGYAMLRPGNWTPTDGDFPDGRAYLAPGTSSDQREGIVIRAVNLELPQARLGPASDSSLWALFEPQPTLAGWTRAIENQWTAQGQAFSVIRTLPAATIYFLPLPTPAGYVPQILSVTLVAYVVDKGEPLVITLSANGTVGDLGRLEANGIVDDFVTIVASSSAIPGDDHRIDPSLP